MINQETHKPVALKARQWLVELNKLCSFMSREVPGKRASSSELQRWIEQGSILFNGERVKKDELIDFPIISVVLFPKSEKHRTTLW